MDYAAVTKPLVCALLFEEKEDAWKDELEKLKQLEADQIAQLIEFAEDRAKHFREHPYQSGMAAVWG